MLETVKESDKNIKYWNVKTPKDQSIKYFIES